MKREVLGLTEIVLIKGKNENGGRRLLKVKAKIDTGASKSSICDTLVKKLNLQPHDKTVTLKSAFGKQRRRLIKVPIKIKGKGLKAYFSVSDRRHLKHDILIGLNILKRWKFLIDPLK